MADLFLVSTMLDFWGVSSANDGCSSQTTRVVISQLQEFMIQLECQWITTWPSCSNMHLGSMCTSDICECPKSVKPAPEDCTVEDC